MGAPHDTRHGPASRPRHVLVVGGGIAGLAAAHRLLAGGVQVTMLEAATRLGGKLLTGEVAGCRIDLGAESLLARRPEAVALARAVGLGDALQPPVTASSVVFTRGALRPLPTGHVMGVPGDPEALRGLLSDEGVARVAREAELPPAELGEDVAFGAHVAARMGHEVVDRLVEPLLGGVYAGDAYRISLRAAAPALYRAVRAHGSLSTAVRELRAAGGTAPAGPVFTGVEGGVGRLPTAVAEACRDAGATILTGAAVRELRRAPDGWRAVTGDGVVHRADAVVLAVPAPAAARLLADEAPAAARELRTVEYASMALVTLAFRRADLGDARLSGSGFLVPPVDGRTIKASTFSGDKWAWVRDQDPDLLLLRTSVGRYGEEHLLEREDDELVAASLRDLRDAVGLAARPVASHVTRWHAGLPQYAVGHLARVARVRAAAHRLPGLALCGAAYDGVGVPACVASGRAAAERLLSGGDGQRAPRVETVGGPRENGTMTGAPEKAPNAGKRAKDLNDVIRYTCWSVFRLREVLPEDRAGWAEEVEELFALLAKEDVTVRGTYDVSGMRANADVMIWWHAGTSDALQAAYNRFRRTRLGRTLEPVWSNMALHRPAEFNKSHIPAFLAGEEPRPYLCVYPFVRSYDWYLLPEDERRGMLAEHGKMARGFPDVRANTVASFALGDYEWILAFEADELHRIVDLMRHLRGSEARRHVREEVPFFTGRRKPVAELVAALA